MSEKHNTNKKPKRVMVSQSDMPNHSLEQALKIAQALWDHFAGKNAAPHSIAMALRLSPTSGSWRNLCGASIGYGLTEGGYAASSIVLTSLGRRIVAPTTDGDDVKARRDAALSPRIQREFFEKYDKAKFPRDDIAANVLVEMGIPKNRSEDVIDLIKENGKLAGFIHDTKTGLFIAVEGASFSLKLDAEERRMDGENKQLATQTTSQGKSSLLNDSSKRLFIAHGKNTKPLSELKGILEQFKIPHSVAVDEPHNGRPISKKVAELMRGSSAGIFIFTKDTQYNDMDGNEVWRPSENVVYELGAASVLWENKIIILREDGVNFPSDFSDLGYITFKSEGLTPQAMDILKELVGLKLVKIQAS